MEVLEQEKMLEVRGGAEGAEVSFVIEGDVVPGEHVMPHKLLFTESVEADPFGRKSSL